MELKLENEFRVNERLLLALANKPEPYCIVRVTYVSADEVMAWFSLLKKQLVFKEGQEYQMHLHGEMVTLKVNKLFFNRAHIEVYGGEQIVSRKLRSMQSVVDQPVRDPWADLGKPQS